MITKYWKWLLLAAMVGLSRESQAADQPAMHFVTKPFPPYTQAGPADRPVGPMVDILRAACAKLGWTCIVELLPWRRAIGMAERGEVDGIFPIVDSPERRAAFLLSPPVVNGRYVLLAKPGQALFVSSDRHELAGRTLAVYGPSDAAASLLQLLEGVSGARMEIETDQRTVMRKLSGGRYGEKGLALVNEAAANQMLAKDSIGDLQSVMVVKGLAYAFAFVPKRMEAPRMIAFSKAIYELCISGASGEIFRQSGLPAAACRAP